jgi:N-acyl-L-homoserine lactone synthetase
MARFVCRELSVGQLREAGRLRHGFFVQERGWAKAASDDIELDVYDSVATHLGVFLKGRLVAYGRGLRGNGPKGMMLDRDFRAALRDDEYSRIIRHRSMEFSRRVVCPSLGAPERLAAAEHLFQLCFAVAMNAGIEHAYLVQEPAVGRVLERMFGLRFTPLNAKPYQFPDGTTVNVDYASITSIVTGLKRSGRWKNYETFSEQYLGRELNVGGFLGEPLPA